MRHRKDTPPWPYPCSSILIKHGINPDVASSNPRRPRRAGVDDADIIKRSHYLATDALARGRMETT